MKALWLTAAAVLVSACAVFQRPQVSDQIKCAAICMVTDALECWGVTDFPEVIPPAVEFVSCQNACAEDPSFAVNVDVVCLAAGPRTCRAAAECLQVK